jgi:biotin carboxylase
MVTPAKKLAGKKLLLLGTNTGTCDMVNYAKSQGAYVIVTDNLPPEKSPAKLIADEAWPVSTADIDTMEQLAIKNKINGIFTGASEFNIERVLTLCERLRLPFYCNRKQWETCCNKQLFKQLCRDNDVPIAREYHIDDNYVSESLKEIQYPVIVKPVDSSAGIGIRICNNESELAKARTKAVSLSKSKQAIIEELIEGDEFTAAYTIKDGQFSLTIMADRYFSSKRTDTIPLPQLAIFPSKYTKKYSAEISDQIIKMFRGIGLANGFIFVQGILNNSGFHIFEANYRLPGSTWHRFISRVNGINYMEMLVNYALTGKMEGYDLSLDNPELRKLCCILHLVSKGGVVGKIIGLDDIMTKRSLITMDALHDVGDYIEKSGTLRQDLFKFYLIEDTIQDLKISIREIQDTVKVLDDKGQDMLMPPFDTDRITNQLS